MKKIQMEDIAALRFLSAPTLSPDGKRLAYLVTQPDRQENCYRAQLRLYDSVSGEDRALGCGGDFLWDDDKTLLVRAEESEGAVYAPHTLYLRVCAETGARERAFSVPGKVVSLKKFQPGVYAATIVCDKNAPDPKTMTEDECLEELDYHVIEEAPLWRNGRGYVAGKRNVLHLFREADGTLTPLTNPTTEVRDFVVCGDQIAIIARDWQDTLMDTFCELSLYHGDTGETEQIVAPGCAKVGRVAFAGGKLVYTCSDNQRYGTSQLGDFYTYDLESREKALLCPHGGLAVGGAVLTDVFYGAGTTWKSVGEKVFFLALQGYERSLYTIDLAGTIERVAHFAGGCIEYFDTDGETLYLAAAEKDSCLELYRAGACAAPTRITRLNDDYFADRFVAKTEYVPFVNREGIAIDGFVLKPIDYDESKRYPALFEIHGGPRAAYGSVMMHEMQVFASKGYFVFFCNPRGSEGKGEDFADIRGKHGTIDYEDLMAFVDHILQRYPQIDEKRVAAAGGSYAGFMCNWIEGHTDRFAAIASQRSVSDFVADFCISDIGFTYDREAAGGDPWKDTEKLWFHSPYRYAPFAKTPILFIHALCDYDCTIDQGVEMFQAMKYFGVPSRMCLFEGEDHELSRTGKPRHRIRRLREIAAWIDRYLGVQPV